MPLYRSKPVLVEAFQFTGDPVLINTYIRAFGGEIRVNIGDWTTSRGYELWVEKSDRWCMIEVGTYVIKERDGKGCYPCVESEFVTKYDAVLQEGAVWGGGQTHPSNTPRG